MLRRGLVADADHPGEFCSRVASVLVSVRLGYWRHEVVLEPVNGGLSAAIAIKMADPFIPVRCSANTLFHVLTILRDHLDRQFIPENSYFPDVTCSPKVSTTPSWNRCGFGASIV